MARPTRVPLAVTHFALGATLTTLLLAVARPRSLYSRTASVCGGVWATLPDVDRLLDLPFLAGVDASPLANVCWFHAALDAVDAGNAPVAGAAALAAFGVVTLWDERRASTATVSSPPASASSDRAVASSDPRSPRDS